MGPVDDWEPGITRIAESDELRAALEKHVEEVVGGPAFKGSQRSALFLRHVVAKAIAGHFESLKERAIGVELFGRSASYVTGEDAIVRVTANHVRKRLAEHYERYGTDAEFRIKLPPGSYIPEMICWGHKEPRSLHANNVGHDSPVKSVETSGQEDSEIISEVEQNPVSVASSALSLETAPSRGHSTRRWLSLVILFGALNVALFGILLYGIVWLRSAPRKAVSVSVLPWSALFSSPYPTHLITSDPNFAEIQALVGVPISLSDYANHNYVPKNISVKPEVRQICMSVLIGDKAASVDTQIAVAVAELAQSSSRKIDVHTARSIQFSDLRTDDNFILLGSPRSDPWSSLFSDQLDFQFFNGEGQMIIRNVHPSPGEQPFYVPTALGGGTGQSFAIVAFIQNPNQNGQVLLLAGANAEGTAAAGKFVTDLSQLRNALQKCGIPPSSPLRHFELLLRVNTLAGSPSKYDVAACHILSGQSVH